MTIISAEQLGSMYVQAFVQRTTTMTELGTAYTLEDLLATVRAVRHTLSAELESASASAFTAQEAPEGEENWSAGQVMTHLVTSLDFMLRACRPSLGLEPVAAAPQGDMQAQPTRADAQALLAQMNETLDAFIAGIPADADLDATSTHPQFGDMSTRAWLLLVGIHESDHANQIRALA